MPQTAPLQTAPLPTASSQSAPSQIAPSQTATSQPSTLPQEISIALQRAQVDCQGGEWAQVIAQCETAIAKSQQCLKQQMSAEAWIAQEKQLKQSGDVAGAVRTCLEAVQHQPRLYAIYNRLRYNLMRYDIPDGDPVLEEIVDVCQQIVQKLPGLQMARVTLGYALTKLGRVDEATTCFREACDRFVQRQLKESGTALPDTMQVPQRHASDFAPNFMIIGAEKCGTTSLYQYLRQHPAVMSPIEKEIDFFDMEYQRGLDWYLAHFPSMPEQPGWITGETSANYLYSKEAPARVFEHFPNLQLIVILRNPIERALSRYSMMVRNGVEDRSFEDIVSQEMQQIERSTTAEGIPWSVLNRCRHLGNSLYYYHLQRWLSHFPKDQLHILQSEALFAQPTQVLSQLCDQLGIESPPANQSYARYNAGDYQPTLSDEMRQQLNAFFRPHTRKLEACLSRSFGWDADA